jgi:branched-subunit amino acid aminotransferase/4-amino-4-deoxychorismate lyase
MRRLIEIVLLVLFFPIAALDQDRDAEELVRQYVGARSQTMQETASSSDIERVLWFCSERFVYEHPSAGARIVGKEKARAGMSGYLGETKNATYTLQILASNSHVVVAQVDQLFLMKQENGIWTPGKRSNITVFEVERGKMARILDY